MKMTCGCVCVCVHDLCSRSLLKVVKFDPEKKNPIRGELFQRGLVLPKVDIGHRMCVFACLFALVEPRFNKFERRIKLVKKFILLFIFFRSRAHSYTRFASRV